jgi:hypothetical protein
MKFVVFCLLVFSFTQFSLADATLESRVKILPENQLNLQAGAITYSFQLQDTVEGKLLSDVDLNESHTKKIHFIAYDSALKEFSHVHPTFNGSIWTTQLNLPVSGNYILWTQGELLDGTEFSVSTRTSVIHGLPQNPILPLIDIRTGTDHQTTLELSKTKLKAGKMVMLTFKVSRTDGVPPVMSPYLGALAHVIATPSTGDDLIHVHPMDGTEPNTGMLHATFPKEGSYRLWVQFIEHDELKIIPLSVIVSK